MTEIKIKDISGLQSWIQDNAKMLDGDELVTISFFKIGKPVIYTQMNISGLFRV